MTPEFAVVVPTVGRESVHRLLGELDGSCGPRPTAVIVVDDRADPDPPLRFQTSLPVTVLCSGGRGPAAARNVGWRAGSAEWICFLDDDVVPARDWAARLVTDLADLPARVAGSQGRITVPLPTTRRPTDWERNTAALAHASWITADMAYRKSALDEVGGFDERFRRAYREDADLALRIMDRGYRLVRGERRVTHPVRPAGFWASVRAQAGNADDALMRRIHGPHWRVRAHAPAGRLRAHLAVTAAGLATLWRPRLAGPLWLALTARFAAERLAPGPRTGREILRMLATSAVIPAAAVAHRIRGELRARAPRPAPPAAVLFDRDGTLVHDVPYNNDPSEVVPMPQARAALDRLRRLGIPVGVVTNQSGVGRGLVAAAELSLVNKRVEELLGPFDVWQICPHDPARRCACRKPAPALVRRAAAALGVPPERCVVIGDIGADVAAARAAGARGILVPTSRTRPQEVRAAPEVASDLLDAVALTVDGVGGPP